MRNQTQYIRQSIKEDNVLVLKAEVKDQIVGHIVVYFNRLPKAYFQLNKRALIGNIGVDENYRHQGIGTAPLKAVESLVKKRHISVLEIDCYTFNGSAENLYDRLGYDDIKYRRRKLITAKN